MQQKVIKIDCDGVLRDLLPGLCELYNNSFTCSITPENIKEYDLSKTFIKCMEIDGMLPNKWFFQEHGHIILRNAPALPKAKIAMDILHKKGYYIVIVSHQSCGANQLATIEWLDSHQIYYDSICFTNQKDIVKGDIIVDDNVEFLNMCPDERRICIKAPYNVGKHKYEEFDNLYDFVQTLKNI